MPSYLENIKLNNLPARRRDLAIFQPPDSYLGYLDPRGWKSIDALTEFRATLRGRLILHCRQEATFSLGELQLAYFREFP